MKKYVIEHDSAVKILNALDKVPYAYVKNIVPYFEKSLKLLGESENGIEKTSEKENSKKEISEEKK